MKKIALLVSAFALLVTSCTSSDDSPPNETGDMLPRTITDVSPLDGTLTSQYVYNGNKIVSSTDSDGVVEQYTYTGDRITRIKYYTGTFLEQQDNYTYDGQGRITSYQRIDPDDSLGNLETFTYNSNGTVSTSKFIGDDVTQDIPSGTGIIYFTNGEATKIELFDGPDLLSTYNFTYDTKNSPFKNITGFNALSYVEDDAGGMIHNVLTADYDGTDYTYDMTYNANNYPTTVIEKESGILQATITISYE
jgi:hypothetical protein